jgi:hypothetical protein
MRLVSFVNAHGNDTVAVNPLLIAMVRRGEGLNQRENCLITMIGGQLIRVQGTLSSVLAKIGEGMCTN